MVKIVSPQLEQELIEQILSGRSSSARKLYDFYHQPLKSFVRSRTQSPEDAEEIVQDTFLSALDSLPLFSGTSTLFSWMCGIARHEISDYYRKKRIKTLVISHFPLLEDLLYDSSWSSHYDQLELRQLVESVLNRLLPRYRQILQMKYLEGWPVADIAKHLNESFKSTETALFRARKAFAVEWQKTVPDVSF